ncbi:hypothetical protein [Ammoniphilus sp. YIM 78166]|uniref:hypothetical protein n=1 Tax=Ammoniphilus sp. YIM 78166 TaxID=1644106 RepID=UPI00106F696D|nr:hypothetical protein [Ammoniphilus sp. YIM 78166]
MNFFNKLNQFREQDRDPKSKEEESLSPSEDQEVSIRELWQQAVNSHKEKQVPKEEEVEPFIPPPAENAEALTPEVDTPHVDEPLREEALPELVTMAEPEPELEGSSFVEAPTSKLEMAQDEDPSSRITSFAQLTLEELTQQAEEILVNLYHQQAAQVSQWYGLSLHSMSVESLKQTQLGQALQAIIQVYKQQGLIHNPSLTAVHQVHEALWKPLGDTHYRVPEEWHHTPLGYLCRYILAGQPAPIFDPVDVSTAAAILGQSERSIVDHYPRYGGVKLLAGYVFSRHKLEEYRAQSAVQDAIVSPVMKEQYYLNTKNGMKLMMQVRTYLNDAYEQVRYLRELLVRNIDFEHNRIRQGVKIQVEKRLAEIYQGFIQLKSQKIEKLPINKYDCISYGIPNVFSAMDQLEGSSIQAEAFITSLEETVKLMDEERLKVNSLITDLAKNLGYLDIELEPVNN